MLPVWLEEDSGCLNKGPFVIQYICPKKKTILSVSLLKRYSHYVLFSDFTCLNLGLLLLLVEIACSDVKIYSERFGEEHSDRTGLCRRRAPLDVIPRGNGG